MFVLALVPRFGLVLLSRGGLTGNFGYDPAVYYTSADALVHGRLPYRDFVLLHPPALMITLTPFAVLGRLTSDHVGFIVGNIAFMILGAGNATLVVVVARRLRIPAHAAVLGGIFYALWLGVVTTETSSRLEPLGSFFFLLALWALLGQERTRNRLLLGGMALGASAAVKIWWIAPLVVLVGWEALSDPTRRRALWVAGGSVISLSLILGPFFVLAPSAMWRMVVTDQLGRHRSTNTVQRLNELSSLHAAFPSLHGAPDYAALVLIGFVVATLGVRARRSREGRVVLGIAVLQLAVLLVSPTYFPYYSGYPAVAFALVVAISAGSGRNAPVRISGPAASGAVIACAALLTVAALVLRSGSYVAAFPGSQLASRVSGVRCVMADAPMALIELNVLSRDLANGCPNWVDVSGRTYGVDSPPGGRYARREHNAIWQSDIRRYLLSGGAFMIIRPQTGLSKATRAFLTRQPVLARSHGYVIYRVP